jgi:RNA polymerase sigma-70 factor (sigma-E family)
MPDSPLSDFDEFAQAQLQGLLDLAWILTRNEHDAWDLVQDSLARVRPKWSGIRNRDNPTAYVRRVLINLNLNRVRRLRRELLTPKPPDASVPPAAGASGTGWLENALARLSPRQRAAVTLAYIEDMPVAEIAHVLECSVSSVKTHLARARGALRAAAPTAYTDSPTHR